MEEEITQPEFKKSDFTCPHCQVHTQMKWILPNEIQHWLHIAAQYISEYEYGLIDKIIQTRDVLNGYMYPFSFCTRCKKINIWIDKKIIYPKPRLTPLPNKDLPEDIKNDYEEASAILQDSPRGACALLRLALQKLMLYLEGDENLNRVIEKLKKNDKINETVRKALDSVRVIGNQAVHPAELNINDNPEIAIALFKVINYIAKSILTDKKDIDKIYDSLPENTKRENRT